MRIELTTFGLRDRYSTTELLVHDWLRVADSNDRFPGYEPSEMTASLTRIEFVPDASVGTVSQVSCC